MGKLNTFLQIDMTTNTNITAFAAYGNYELKIAYYNNPLFLETLINAGSIYGTF